MLVNITPNLTQAYWNALVGPFEAANPNISVKIVMPVNGVGKTLPTLLASGDVPDVVETLTPNATLAPELVDLSKYTWAKKGPLADQYKMDGKNLVAGVGFQLQGTIFYNKKAFQDAAAKLVEYLVTDKAAVISQLQADGNFRTGYEYKTTPLGDELQKIIADTPAKAFTPSGDGYGERTVAPGYNAELNTEAQALMTGESADAMLKAMDDWFAAQ
jgi:multiple sugar transport system substrate-binding protein/raffinose/stachyose/melibiose transport system substrate-binding protein